MQAGSLESSVVVLKKALLVTSTVEFIQLYLTFIAYSLKYFSKIQFLNRALNFAMKTSQLTIYLSLLFCFFLNTAMMSSKSDIVINSNIEQQKKKAQPTKMKKKRFKKFRKIKKRLLKSLRKVTGVEDGPTMLLAIGAVIIGGILIYYLFQMGFFVGLLAIVAVSFLLYLLFSYLNY